MVKKSEFYKIFKDLKILKNDTIMVHGDAGVLAQYSYDKSILNFFFDSLIKYIGKNGNILIPAFTTSFCRKRIFNIQSSKSEVGLFSEIFRKRKDTKRTSHPIFSFSIYGKKWKYFNSSETNTCFGENSLFDFFLKEGGKIIILGSTFEKVTTFVHYIEQKMSVDYRYLKKFDGYVISNKKRKITTLYYVRKRKNKTRLITPGPLSKILTKTKIGRYYGYSISSKKLFNHCKKYIKKNNNYLVG